MLTAGARRDAERAEQARRAAGAYRLCGSRRDERPHGDAALVAGLCGGCFVEAVRL